MNFLAPSLPVDQPTRAARWRAVLAIFVLAGMCGYLVYRCNATIDLAYAKTGGSALQWIYVGLDPQKSTLDWPNGTRNLGKSLFMNVFRAAYAVGVAPEDLVPFVLFSEVFFLAFGFWFLAKTLFTHAPPELLAFMVTAVVITSARDMDLARFGQPFYFGLYYNITDGLRLLALACVLRKRVVAGGFLAALAFMTHPTMGLMGIAFLTAVLWQARQAISIRRGLAAAAVLGVVAGGWVLATFQSANINVGTIPLDMWLGLTKMFNFHWYPFESGYFTVAGHMQFLPFVAFCVLLLAAFIDRALRPLDRQILAGFGAVALMTLTGLAISLWLSKPFLIKLALHRANDLIVMVGLLYVYVDLWKQFTSASVLERLLAALLMLSPFFAANFTGFPLALTVGYGLVRAAGWWRAGRSNEAAALAAAAVVTAAVAGIYLATGIGNAFTMHTYLAWPFVLSVWGALGWWVAAPLAALAMPPKTCISAAALVLMAVLLGILNIGQRYPEAGDRGENPAAQYKAAQLWVRDHTPETALIMADPAVAHAWREYSRRASFGCPREWLHNAWLYNSDPAYYNEGLRRFAEFGIDLKPYLAMTNVDYKASRTLEPEARRVYYAWSDERRSELARKYGIDYFVFDKTQLTAPIKLPVRYENKFYLVTAALPDDLPVPAPGR